MIARWHQHQVVWAFKYIVIVVWLRWQYHLIQTKHLSPCSCIVLVIIELTHFWFDLVLDLREDSYSWMSELSCLRGLSEISIKTLQVLLRALEFVMGMNFEKCERALEIRYLGRELIETCIWAWVWANHHLVCHSLVSMYSTLSHFLIHVNHHNHCPWPQPLIDSGIILLPAVSKVSRWRRAVMMTLSAVGRLRKTDLYDLRRAISLTLKERKDICDDKYVLTAIENSDKCKCLPYNRYRNMRQPAFHSRHINLKDFECEWKRSRQPAWTVHDQSFIMRQTWMAQLKR